MLPKRNERKDKRSRKKERKKKQQHALDGLPVAVASVVVVAVTGRLLAFDLPVASHFWLCLCSRCLSPIVVVVATAQRSLVGHWKMQRARGQNNAHTRYSVRSFGCCVRHRSSYFECYYHLSLWIRIDRFLYHLWLMLMVALQYGE